MTSPTIRVAINGEMRQVRAGFVADLIEELELEPATILIEHNGDALQRSEWAMRVVEDGDRFELLRIAAGG
jgi:thiamine biosynthesis protein ThiS